MEMFGLIWNQGEYYAVSILLVVHIVIVYKVKYNQSTIPSAFLVI